MSVIRRQQRACLAAYKRRKQRIKNLTPLQRVRYERMLRAERRRQRIEMGGCRGFFCWVGNNLATEEGGVGKSGTFILFCLALLFFSILAAPALIMMGAISFMVGIVVELPGAKAALKIFGTLTCNKVADALDEVNKKAGDGAGLLGDAVGFVKDRVTDVTGAIGGALGGAFKGLGGLVGGVPLVGKPSEWVLTKAGDGTEGVFDAAGAVVATPLTLVEAGFKLVDMGTNALSQLKSAICGLKRLADQFEKAGLEDPLRAALSCANWPEYLNGGKPDKKWCLDPEKDKDDPEQVPAWLVPIYQSAASRYDVPWEVLAAINWNDTEYGAKGLESGSAFNRLGQPLLIPAKQIEDLDDLEKKEQKRAARSVVAEWQVPNKEHKQRVGWIPFNSKEWEKYGIDGGSIPPGYRGNPYKGDYCPQPLDVKGNTAGGLSGGGSGINSGKIKIPPYPGRWDEKLPKEKIAKWMADGAKMNGLPPELPVMAALVESNLYNNPDQVDHDSEGFFQMRVSIWDKGPYKGFTRQPEKQLLWFITESLKLKKDHRHAEMLKNPSSWGEFIADVERPAAKYRGRYQLRLNEARRLIGGASVPSLSNAEVVVNFIPDSHEDTCDPVDGVFTLAHYLSKNGAAGDTWPEAELMRGGEGDEDDSVSGPIAERIVELAKRELAKGVKEEPAGSDNSKDIARYRTATKGSAIGPWCSYFTSYIARKAGVPVGDEGQGFGWAMDNYSWGKKKKITHDKPEAGDLIVFGGTGHVGIVIAVDGKKITTIEGNYSHKISKVNRSVDEPKILGFTRLAELKGQNGGGKGDARDPEQTEGDAKSYAEKRKGDVSFAVADKEGKIIASYRKDASTHSASITKAMVMAAYLRTQDRVEDRADLKAMIQQSSNEAANRLYAKVGKQAVQDLAEEAKMKNFRLVEGQTAYRLGDSRITAEDQAKFFSQIFKLIPSKYEDYAKELLGGVTEGRWGVLKAAGDKAYGKSGWRPEADGSGWTVVNGGHADGLGVAVLTDKNPSQDYGVDTVDEVAKRLLSDGAGEITSKLPPEHSGEPPAEFQAKNLPPLDQLKKPNPDLPDAGWVARSPRGGKFPTFESGLNGVGKLAFANCSEFPQPSEKQMGIFKAAGQAFEVPWQAVAGLVDMGSKFGCEQTSDWSVFERDYAIDAGGDRSFDDDSLLDSSFSSARTLYAYGAGKDMRKALEKMFDGDPTKIAQAAFAMRRMGLNTEKLVDLTDGLMSQAIQSRDHLINKNLCPKIDRYVDCIAKLYLKIRTTDPNSEGGDNQTGDALGGSCNPEPAPDLDAKAWTSRKFVRNRQREGVNTTNGETWGREDAVKATVAVIKKFQECFPKYKKNWQLIRINDWGGALVKSSYGMNADGHASHKNGGDNDLTIEGVTWYNMGGSYDRKASLALARMFLKAGAVEIYFNDKEVRKKLKEDRAGLAEDKPKVKKKLGAAWRDQPVGSAYNPDINHDDTLHNNHFHVRWYSQPGNTVPAKIRVYLSEGEDEQDEGCESSERKKKTQGPYSDQGSDSGADCGEGERR